MSKKLPFQTVETETKALQGRTCRIPLTATEYYERTEPTKMHEITWRIFRIMAEFVEGFQFLSDSSREITIFGSARYTPSNHWYKEARKLGLMLAQCGFTVITGGGPGIMEASNRGATDGGGESIGLNIQLPNEQRVNPYVKRGRAFHYFFTRKVIMAASAQAYVYFPGGFGTLNEFFEMVTLIQTQKSQRVPIVLVGLEFWTPMIEWIEKELRDREKTISQKDVDLFKLVDTAEEAFDLLKDSKERTLF